ncbi:MAG: DNA repair protein [Ligilactobacillus salivarius]|nr:DNA repair protein [Ligilactobacillus salivarius]
MKKMMRYKDFYGTIEYFLDDNIFYGKVIGINGLISYEGKILEELIKDCNEIVYEYLEDCKSQGIKPRKLKRTKKIIE